MRAPRGRVAERLNAPVLKTGNASRRSRVRISPLPPLIAGLFALAACGPAHPPPPGFAAACYGGDYKKHMNGAQRLRLMVVQASEADWPELARDMIAAGKALGLETFDVSTHEDFIHTIEVHLCSPQGLEMFADQRRWIGEQAEASNAHRNFSEVPIAVYTYTTSPHYDWKRTSDELLKLLETKWRVADR
jgi:hypothetical protein